MTTVMTTNGGMTTISQIRSDTMKAVAHATELGDTFSRDLAIASGLVALREAFVPEVVGKIASLAGTALGFRHDLEPRGQKYDPAIIRDCAIEALLRGLSLTGNQFNIIAGRCYVTREGYSSLLANYPGLTDLEIEIGLPEDAKAWGKQEMVFVTAAARCKVNGRPVSVECRKSQGFDGRLAVKTFSGEVDNAKGKAQRRLLKLLYERITGSVIDEPEDGVASASTVTVVEPTKLESQPAVADPWAVEYGRLTSPRAQDAWQHLLHVTTVEEISVAEGYFGKLEATGPEKQSLKRFAEHRRDVLKGVA